MCIPSTHQYKTMLSHEDVEQCEVHVETVWREMCSVWREMYIVWRDMCSVWREMSSVWREMCSVWRDMCSVWRDMCSVWRDMCSVAGHVQCVLTLNRSIPLNGNISCIAY